MNADKAESSVASEEPTPVNQKSKLVLLCFVILLSGIVIGAVGFHLYMMSRRPQFRQPQGPHMHFIRELSKKDKLTEQEEEKIKEIFERNFEEIHTRLKSVVDPMIEKTQAELKATLGEKHHAAIDEEFERMKKHRERGGPGGPGGPPPGGPGGPPPPPRDNAQ